MILPLRDIDSKVGWTVTSFEVENSIRSSALRSIPPASSAMVKEGKGNLSSEVNKKSPVRLRGTE